MSSPQKKKEFWWTISAFTHETYLVSGGHKQLKVWSNVKQQRQALVTRELPDKPEGFLMTWQSCVPLCFVQVRIFPLSTSRDNRSFKMRILNNKKCTQIEGKEEHKREMIHCHNWSRRITYSCARSSVVLGHCANESPFVYTLGVAPYQYREETETICSRDYTSNFSENF